MKVVIIDDHQLLRSGLALALESSEFQVVAQAASVTEGLAVLNKFQPSICIVDINLGESSGLDLIRQGILQNSNCRFVVLTMHDQTDDLEEARKAGASAFVTKGGQTQDLIEIMRCISSGSDKFMKSGEIKQSKYLSNFNLTNRELQVLSLLPTGATATAIAGILFLTQPTVKTHLASIYRKLDASNRAQAVSIAYENNLITQ